METSPDERETLAGWLSQGATSVIPLDGSSGDFNKSVIVKMLE
jgi:hypothetical protein